MTCKFPDCSSTNLDKYFETMNDSFCSEWDWVDKDILLKIVGNMAVTTNTATSMFLQRVIWFTIPINKLQNGQFLAKFLIQTLMEAPETFRQTD